VNIQKILRRRIRERLGGVDVDGDVNAVISANVGEQGSLTGASSSQHVEHHSHTTAVAADTSEKAEEEPDA
jgi:ABC-type polysaccharide/polyol phosphate transport system ATPase subunit